MSWSINIIGKSADVNAAVQANPHIPTSLKDTVALFAAAGEGSANKQRGAMQVKSSGHYDAANGWSSISQFSIEPVELAPPAT